MPDESSRIFISYARKDSEFALKLAKDLRTAGANIWVDQLDVSVSDRWDRVTEEALESCGSFLIILSPDSVASENVLDEIAYALEEKKQIFPVVYKDCKIPFRIRRIQRSDFTKDYGTGLKQLLGALPIQAKAQRIEQADSREEIPQETGAVEAEKKSEPQQTTTKPGNTIRESSPAVPAPRKKWIIPKPAILVLSVVIVVAGYFIFKPMFGTSPPDRENASLRADSLASLTKTTDIKPADNQPAPKYHLRSQPQTLSDTDVQNMLKKNDFYETDEYTKDWNNPQGKGIANNFQRKGDTVYDAATGLTWQQGGSDKTMTFGSAQDYIEQLNRNSFAGYSDWRLPTLEEAMSLMEPKKNEDGLYINPVFDSKQRWIWTADEYSASGAWVVIFAYGSCYDPRVDIYGYYVRAVR